MNKNKIIQYLEEQGVYNPIYLTKIEQYLMEYKLYRKAVKEIDEQGLLIAGNGDGTFYVKNPNISTKNECLKNMQSIEKQMGLSVADSVIFKELVGETTNKDGFEDLQ